MVVKKPRLKRSAIRKARASKSLLRRASRIQSQGHPSIPIELAGKWIAWSPRGQIVASGSALSDVMADVASMGIEGASYQLVPRFGHPQAD